MPVQCLSHIGICVSDPERSIRFYRDALGFRPLTKMMVSDENSARLVELEGLELRAYFLERDGTRIELLHFESPGHEKGSVPRPMNRLGLTHLALRVDGLAEMLETLEAAGVEIMTQTRIDNPELGSEVVYVLDPDGVRVELIQLPGDPTQPLGEPFS